MSDIVIRAQGLGKRYVIGHEVHGLHESSLREAITRNVRSFARGARGMLQGRPVIAGDELEEFWALRDVDFEVKRGEVLGIIGRNGAGKSTLLKILSRITEPSQGRVTIHGRVASLLEVGTGFHNELTGRENIFLNGAILGMTRAEVLRKFDAIVDFSGVEKFIDTPVKRYSSGMYVRLAFSVAAHLEPDILVVDEVLAVGDAEFQKRSIGKLRETTSAQGRTVIFVSHNLQAIRQLCSSGILLADGRVVAQGSIGMVIDKYVGRNAETPGTQLPPAPPECQCCHATSFRLETERGESPVFVRLGQVWRARVAVRVVEPMADLVLALGITDPEGNPVQTAWTEPAAFAPGDYEFVFTQDKVDLAPGSYELLVGLSRGVRPLYQFPAARLTIEGSAARGFYPATTGVGAVLNSMSTEVREKVFA